MQKDVAKYIFISLTLLSEAMQFSNYVLILALVGPANGFMAANTTTSFRVLASFDGLLNGLNLAIVIAAAIEYCRSRCSQPIAISNAPSTSQPRAILNPPPTSQPRANLKQPPLALIRIEYEKAVRKERERCKIPTTIKIEKKYRSNETDLRDEFSYELQQLWKKHADLIGIGKDARGLAHRYMDIQSIRHVENQYALWRYSCRRQAICDFTASVGGNLKNIHEYKDGCGLVSKTHFVDTDNVFQSNCSVLKSNLSNNVDNRINEYYLFHGTLSLNAESIAKYGFNVNKCKGAMLGKGIYFTDSLVKADQYTQPDDNGICCVIMARVLLGDFVVATNHFGIPSTSIQPPCKECMTTLCQSKPDNPHPRFDAVVYTGGLYKEFVVYNNWQAYPEFIIFYKRL